MGVSGRVNPMTLPRKASDFEALETSRLYCPTCKRARPVRKRLLALLGREMFDYVCARCGTPVGKKRSS